MFSTQSQTSPGSALYQVDGHEFVQSALVGSVECRNCGQEFSEALVGAAASSGLKGVFPVCSARARTVAIPLPFTPIMPMPQLPTTSASRKLPKNLCPICDRELSQYLDFYSGRDPVLKELCRDCRTEREREQDRAIRQMNRAIAGGN